MVLSLVLLAPSTFAPAAAGHASDLAGQSAALAAHGKFHPRIASPNPTLLGAWTNVDPTTQSLVRFTLAPSGTDVTVHAYGACTPTPCDWGTAAGTVYATKVSSPDGVAFSALYTFSFAQVLLTGIMDGTPSVPYLNVQEFTKFTDGSGRSNYYVKERFAKVINRVRYELGPRIPHPHVEGASMVYNNRLFVITGSSGDCTDGKPGEVNRLVDIYNPLSNSFTSGAPVRIGRDRDPVAAIASTPAGPRGFLIGGSSCANGGTVRLVEEYNPVSGLWSPLPAFSNLPASLDGAHHCGAAIGSKIYYFQAGKIGVFNAVSRTWNTLPAPAALSPSLFCKATVIASDLIMITGPGNGSADANSQRILLFTPSTGTITVAPTTTTSMAEHGMVYLPMYGQVLIAGGDFSGENSVQSIGAANIVTNVNPLPMTWDDGQSGLLYNFSGSHMYLAGGLAGGSNTPPVIIATPSF